MAGCFGNHPFDRIMEQQLMRHLEEESKFDCDNCDGSNESYCCGAPIVSEDICSDCGEHCSNQCEDCEFNMDNIKKYSNQRIYGD